MKRYVSFDFLRGCAIVAVLCFHVLNLAYNADTAVEKALDDPVSHIAFILLVVILSYLGGFYTLFVTLSGIVNTISLEKQWNKMIESTKENIETRLLAYKKLLKTQILRGLFIVVLGYVSEALLNGLLLNAIIQNPDLYTEFIEKLYLTNVLHAIGWGIIFSAIVYLKLLQMNKPKEQIIKILVWTGIAIIALTPVMVELMKLLPNFWAYPGKTTASRDLGMNILYFFLAPLVVRVNPIFPNVALAFFGTAMGIQFATGIISKEYLNKLLKCAILMFFVGLICSFLPDAYHLDELMMNTAGSLILLVLAVYLIEVRGKAEKFSKNPVVRFFLRFGLITLTLWCLQWVMVFPLMISHELNNLLTQSSISFLDGPFMNQGLTGWQLCGYLILILAMWSLMLWGWGKVEYRYSFEWLTAKLISRGHTNAAQRMNFNETIFNVQSMVDQPQEFYGRGTKIGLVCLFFVFAILTLVVSM